MPDPYGVHEFRFFAADGKPTLLVMDGDTKSYDKPPTADLLPSPEATADTEGQTALTPASEEEPRESDAVAPRLDSVGTAESKPKAEVRIQMSQTDIDANPSPGHQSAQAGDPPRSGVPPVLHVSDDRQTPTVAERQPEPLTRPQKIAYGVVLGVLALSVLALAYVHLRPHGASPSRSAQRATTSTRVVVTTTTTPLPTALQPGAEAAATALISSWATQNRAGALSVATPSAVTTLFAAHYAAGLAVDRGCSSSFVPIVCTFGPPGGASPTDPIYQVSVSQAPGGWYVSSVKLEN
jgi:hypothetical protein